MQTRRPSVAGRAVLAIVLMIGFYALALGVAGGLLWLVYVQVAVAKRANVKLILGCVIGAGVILWSILPRFDRFVAPGPRLTRERQRRLFAELEKIAQAVGQAMPVEVYLISEVNAWVAQRGGLLGLGSRRIMGLGLPLMQADTLSQFKATIAHEFGHYHGGDTSLGPVIYRTREAVIRTAQNLNASDSILRYPFVGYAKMFLRVTHAVSRAQEISADELACRVVGGKANVTALCAEFAATVAYGPYMENEFLPVLNQSFRPPFAEGLARFLRVKKISTAIEDVVRQEVAEGKKDPYDTHPPLRERIALAETLPPGTLPEGEPKAVALLDGLDALEVELLEAMTGSDKIRTLKPIRWEDVGEQVYVPMWKSSLSEHRPLVVGTTPAALAGMTARLSEIGRAVARRKLGDEEARGAGISVLGAALALALHRHGWVMESEPGEARPRAEGRRRPGALQRRRGDRPRGPSRGGVARPVRVARPLRRRPRDRVTPARPFALPDQAHLFDLSRLSISWRANGGANEGEPTPSRRTSLPVFRSTIRVPPSFRS